MIKNMRYPLVIANWKLHGNKYMVRNFILMLRKKLTYINSCNIVIAPPLIYLNLAKSCLVKSPIMLGAQNVDIHLSGAYTGEISANMLQDVGVQYIIIGHSEHRLYHKEDDKIIAEKFAIVKQIGLIPVLCIGENKTQNIKSICIKQIDLIFNLLGNQAFKNSVIAYEPVWAIGTGKPANPINVQMVHKFIRDYIAQYDPINAEKIIIQYGGSVNTDNIHDLLIQPDIDGVLVGTASLNIDNFVVIVQSAIQTRLS